MTNNQQHLDTISWCNLKASEAACKKEALNYQQLANVWRRHLGLPSVTRAVGLESWLPIKE